MRFYVFKHTARASGLEGHKPALAPCERDFVLLQVPQQLVGKSYVVSYIELGFHAQFLCIAKEFFLFSPKAHGGAAVYMGIVRVGHIVRVKPIGITVGSEQGQILQ